MLSLATRLRRVAGKLARCLATCVFATAGMMLGAIAGVIAGFVSEDGLLQGTLIGAISGAFIAMEVVDSLAKIWCYEEYSIATRAHLMLLVFWNLVIDRLTVRTSVFPTLTTVLDSQLNAVPSRHRRAEVSGDLTGRSYPVVMGMRLAAVDQLPVIKLTAAQTDATGACPICLHVRRRRRSTINTPPSSMNKCTIRDASFTVYSELFCFSFFSPFCRRISRPARLPGDCRRVATSSIWGASTTGCCGMPYAQCAVVLSTKCRCT
nr:NEP1-interacting protein 1 isoform X2 [Oryza sativa Japonica Group]